MKYFAVSITAKEHAELVETVLPVGLDPREIPVQTVYTLISPGRELACNYSGEHFPSFSGYAAAFAAEEWGSEVTGIVPGALRFCIGPHRSFQQVNAEATGDVPVPCDANYQNLLNRWAPGFFTNFDWSASSA